MLVSALQAGTRYDVAILGTGIGGTILGAILARHGQKVLLIEQGAHPRFTIGESTIPETTILFRILAARYGVPEIGNLATYQRLNRYVGASHGVKRNFSFMYHRPGEAQRPEESSQYPTAAPPYGPDVHMFRQDVDAYMLQVAMSYGASAVMRTEITEVAIDKGGVRLRTKQGKEFTASYVVDAGGLKSMLAQTFGLRDQQPNLRTRSRSLFTHMVGVKPYDACIPKTHGLYSPLSQGTLHHVFDRGWMWVIPFNNHPTSTNRLVSVGLNLDIDHHPRTGLPPEEEFRQFISRYPSIAEQFKDATAAQPWMSSDQLQFSSQTAVGERFCMLPHAFGFVDPLFSSGLGVTMFAINAIAVRLIRAATDGDYSAERFAYVDTWTKKNIDFYDRLVSGAYLSFTDFALWNAWHRLWMIGGMLGPFGQMEIHQRIVNSSSPLDESITESFPYRAAQGYELPEFAALFDAAEGELHAYRDGRCSSKEAATRIFAQIERSGLWPKPWGALSPERRSAGTFTLLPLLKLALWLGHKSPGSARKYYFKQFGARDVIKELARENLLQLKHASTSYAVMARDTALDWNSDWSHP